MPRFCSQCGGEIGARTSRGSGAGAHTAASATAYYHAVPVGPVDLRPQPGEVSEARWFGPDELPEMWAPPVNGPRIYSAWRDAFLAGRIETALLDL